MYAIEECTGERLSVDSIRLSAPARRSDDHGSCRGGAVERGLVEREQDVWARVEQAGEHCSGHSREQRSVTSVGQEGVAGEAKSSSERSVEPAGTLGPEGCLNGRTEVAIDVQQASISDWPGGLTLRQAVQSFEVFA